MSPLSLTERRAGKALATDAPSSTKGRAMGGSDNLTAMSDPDFLAEYGRVRDALEALTERMRKLTEEFDRRAGAKWATAN